MKKRWFDDWKVVYKPKHTYFGKSKGGSVEIHLPNGATKTKKYIFSTNDEKEYQKYYNLAMVLDCALTERSKYD